MGFTINGVHCSLGVDPSQLAKQALARVQGELAKDGREPVGLSSFKVREKSTPGSWKSAIVNYSNKKKGQGLSYFIGVYANIFYNVTCRKNELVLFIISEKSALAQFCVDLTMRASED